MSSPILPNSLRLETSTHCQLKCPACETASGKTHETLGGGFLKLENFKKVVDENPWVSHLELSNWGELFLNPEILQIMEYAYEKNVSLSAANGSNLNTVKETVLEGLVKYKFRRITCSIDGASQEIYSIYRKAGNFDRVIENIKTINRYKAKYNSPFPLLTWQYVAFGHNEHEIETARTMAAELDMKFYVKLSWDEGFSPIKNKELVSKQAGLDVSSRSEFEQKYGTGYLQKEICGQLWKMPQINWDGKILGCCYNYWGDFGNAFESGLKEGLNSEKMDYARQMLTGKAEAKAGIPCTDCGHYQRMKRTNDWIVPEIVTRQSWKATVSSTLGRLKVWFTNHTPIGRMLYLKAIK